MMFTPDDRGATQAWLERRATDDPAVIGAALLGSLAAGSGDRWSDVDLALHVGGDADGDAVVDDWTTAMYADLGAVHHLDLWAGRTRYRAFLLDSTMQIDLSFWPTGDFRSLGRPVTMLFGRTGGPADNTTVGPGQFVGMGWLYAVHVRSAIARGRLWQAVHMIDGLRDQAIGLMCLRNDLPPRQGRGVDRLPDVDQAGLAATRASSVDVTALQGSFTAAVDLLVAEIRDAQPDVARRLAPVLQLLAT